jgi:hypothetical protein
MMAGMDELTAFTAFTEARLAEEEAAARDRLCIHCGNPTIALGGPFGVTGYTHGRRGVGNGDVWQGVRCPRRLTGAAPVQNPDRVLREVAAGRAILAVHAQLNDSIWCQTCDPGADPFGDSDAWYPCRTLRAVAAVWSDHADYRAEWAPAPERMTL